MPDTIILIQPPDRNVSYYPPMSLLYLASSVKKRGIDVKIVDMTLLKYKYKLSEDELLHRTSSLCKNSKFIGITAITSQIENIKKIVTELKEKNNDAKIFVGGPHATAKPIETLKELSVIDGVVIGEGEYVLPEIISETNYEKINGISYRTKSGIHVNQRKQIEDLDSLPFLDWSLLDTNYYLTPNNNTLPYVHTSILPIVTSRGCIGRCKFCCSRTIYPTVRFHSAERVLAEIRYLVDNFKPETILFVDEMFSTHRKRVEDICKMLIKEKINKKVRWACSLRVDRIDEKLIKMMRDAGLFYVFYGLESGSQRMLDLMKKDTTVEQNYRAVELTKKYGVLVNSAFIVNLPGETFSDMLATEEFIKKANLDAANVNSLMVLPGSPYSEELNASSYDISGRLPEGDDEIIMHNGIPKEQFLKQYRKMKKVAFRKNWLSYAKRSWRRDPIYTLTGGLSIIKNMVLK